MSTTAAATAPRSEPRIDPDSPSLLRVVVTATCTLAAISFTAGVPGLISVAQWAGLEGPLRAVVPAMLDGGLLVYSAVVTVQRSRQESARFAWAVLTLLTLASAAAQVAHVLAVSDRPQWQTIAGAVLAATFPLLVFASTHSVLAVAVAPPVRRGARRSAPAPVRRPVPVVETASWARPAPSAVAPVDQSSAPPVRPAPRPAPARTDRSVARDQAVRLAAEGLSQRQIADRLGASKSSVARWVSGAATTEAATA